MRVRPGIVKVIDPILASQLIGNPIPIKISRLMSFLLLTLSANHNLAEAQSSTNGKPRSAILEPITPAFVLKRDEVK